MSFLFALDKNTEEVIVSESAKGSNKIDFIERIGKDDHIALYNAVVTLTCLTAPPHFDSSIFKAMDKVCQLLYKKHKGIQ
jgi:hypothetical protein